MLSNSVKFTADADIFVPWKKGAVWQLKAKPITSSSASMGNIQPHNLVKMGTMPTTQQVPGRASVTVSAGISIEVPTGWKLVWTTDPAFAQKGGLITNTGHITSGEIWFYVSNIGRNILSISPGDVIANAWLEKVNDFEWEKR